MKASAPFQRFVFCAAVVSASPGAVASVGSNSPWLPDYAEVQSGAYSGFVAIGAGYGWFSDGVKLSLLQGYTPAEVGGEPLHSTTLKAVFAPLPGSLRSIDRGRLLRIVPFNIGLSAHYCHCPESFLLTPSSIPEGYYPPTALRLALDLSFHLGFADWHGSSGGQRLSIFGQASILDVAIQSMDQNGFEPKRGYVGFGAGARVRL